MPMSLNTNVLSLSSQRNLRNTQASLAETVNRLSTGFRINSAKDDAAGLSITERMTTQINGLSISQRNASDGISFVQTAESALTLMSTSLQRMRELAVQSLNDTNTNLDREALNLEYQSIVSELERVAQTTAFNGRNILDGTTGQLKFQIGPNQGQTISVSGVDARTTTLGETVFSRVRGNNAGSEPGAGESYESESGEQLLVDGLTIDLGDISTLDGAVTRINEKTSQTGTFAFINDAGGVTFMKEGNTAPNVDVSAGSIPFTYFGHDDNTQDVVTYNVAETGVERRDDALIALPVIDNALDELSSLRAGYGATQNRFENVIELAAVLNENLSMARARIRDTDFAMETAELTRLQILQEAGLASVVQANASQQSVLSLLGGR
ncbi:MAG: flagellin [Pseudomonadales bacterium]